MLLNGVKKEGRILVGGRGKVGAGKMGAGVHKDFLKLYV